MAENTVNDIYQGGYSTFDPQYGNVFTGYRVSAREIGAPTKPDTANQLQQVSMLLNQGIIPIEVGALGPEVFESIPKEHFKEINRKAKLAGADISVHAPIVEASGISEQGFDESARRLAEEQLKHVVDLTSPMNEKGGMSITIHSSAKLPGTQYSIEDGKKKEEGIYVVDKESGKIVNLLVEEKRYLPGMTELDINKPKIKSPESQIKDLNVDNWDKALSRLLHNKVDADARIKEVEEAEAAMRKIQELKEQGVKDAESFIPKEERKRFMAIPAAKQFMQDAHQTLNGMFHQAYKFGTDDDRKKLNQLNEIFGKEMVKAAKIMNEKPSSALQIESDAVQFLIHELSDLQPTVFQPVEEFAREHSAKTFANVAYHGLKQYKDKAPTINIENLFPEMAFSSGKELDELIKKTRQDFVDLAVKDGMSKSQAQEKADKLIGVTLDVGHLNMARKKGFGEKDLLKEVDQIAKYVKHVHLTDNFGRNDSHLPPGMGNVPVKEILSRLEQEGFKGKKIVEAGGFVQHFGESPFPYALRGLGAPIFSGDDAPYWNQSLGLQQGYSGGFGQLLPQINYETWGAGLFNQLPMELGGARPGAQGSRLAGRGME